MAPTLKYNLQSQFKQKNDNADTKMKGNLLKINALSKPLAARVHQGQALTMVAMFSGSKFDFMFVENNDLVDPFCALN
jgi:hypothetical protein